MNTEMQKKDLQSLQESTLQENTSCDGVMENPEICQNVFSIILNEKNILNPANKFIEKTLEPHDDSRPIRFEQTDFEKMDTEYDAESHKLTCRFYKSLDE